MIKLTYEIDGLIVTVETDHMSDKVKETVKFLTTLLMEPEAGGTVTTTVTIDPTDTTYEIRERLTVAFPVT